MRTLLQTVSFFVSTSYCLIVFLFCLHFLSSKPFRNNQMHCEIIDRYFNVSVEIQLKEENFKSAFWASEFGRPNRYTGLPNGLNTSSLNPYGYTVLNFNIHCFLFPTQNSKIIIYSTSSHHFSLFNNWSCISKAFTKTFGKTIG